MHYSAQPFNFNLITCNSPQIVQNGACVNPPAPLSISTATGKLNDTGITACADDLINNILISSCPSTHLGQDAQLGRDITDNNPNDGHAGFSFTKIGANGQALNIQNAAWNPSQTGSEAAGTRWSCVQDNVTGLIWEVKTDDNGLHDKDWNYTWYEPNYTINGGNNGTVLAGTLICGGTVNPCNMNELVVNVNQTGWCGANDWRLPTRSELEGIAVLDGTSPTIDATYFPNTINTFYWTSTPVAASIVNQAIKAWSVSFLEGNAVSKNKPNPYPVRLVRN